MLGSDTEVTLLGRFEFNTEGTGGSLLPKGAQRLLALLALEVDGMHRAAAAERLWPDSSPHRAAANLRSAMWCIRRVGLPPAVESVGPRIRLSPHIRVDLRQIRQRVRTLVLPADYEVTALVDDLSRELLPGWPEDWLILERERWDQVRLHALEALAQQLLIAEQYLPALQTALAAVSIEPIREAAHRTIIEIHTAEGNAASALKHYHEYRTLLQRELGTGPSARMTPLVHALLAT